MISYSLDLAEKLEPRSEEHTSELQSHSDLVCRLLLDAARKRGELADLDVVRNPFPVIQRAVFTPDLAGLGGHLAIGRDGTCRSCDPRSGRRDYR